MKAHDHRQQEQKNAEQPARAGGAATRDTIEQAAANDATMRD
jgi:hypothetical protein